MTTESTVNPAAATATVRQLAEQIAGLLPETWIVVPDHDAYDRDNHATLARIGEPDGVKLYLRQPYNKPGRVSISGEYPRGGRSNFYPRDEKIRPETITVAMSRGADAIAKEIIRRYLPAYRVAYMVGLKERRLDEIAADRRANVVAEFAALVGGRTLGTDGRFYGDHEFHFSNGHVNHDGTEVSLDLRHMPLDLARKVITVIRDYTEARRQA